MSATTIDQLATLFDERFPLGVRFQQDGIILKGNPNDDKRNYLGSLFIVLQPPSTTAVATPGPTLPPRTGSKGSSSVALDAAAGSSTSESPIGAAAAASPPAYTPFLVWIPYSCLFCLAPHLVTPAARRAIEADSEQSPVAIAPAASGVESITTGSASPSSPSSPTAQSPAGAAVGGGAGGAGKTKIEWAYSICVPIGRVAKLQRKSNLRGKKILTVTRIGNSVENPLVFQDGGIMKFFDELKKVAEVKPVGQSQDEFSVEERRDVLARMEAAVKAGDFATPAQGCSSDSGFFEATAGSPSSGGATSSASPSSSSNVTASGAGRHHKDPVAAFERELYGVPPSPGVMSQMLNFGATLTQKGRGIAEAVMTQVTGTPLNAQRSAATAAGDRQDTDEFCMVEAVVSVENIVPIIQAPASRRMGAQLSPVEWRECLDRDGRVDAEMFRDVRAKAFLGGVAPEIRAEVWSFLLNVYPLSSTAAQRAELRAARKKEYENIRLQWQLITPEQESKFSQYREHKIAIEKDVIRTDRNHPAFADEHGEKMKFLYNILMTYAMFNFDLGYCQGMSDMLSVILLLYEEESVAFTHFKHLMAEKVEGNFRNDVKANMAKQLETVDRLVRIFVPPLYYHLERAHATGMAFCFRWLLVLFKRELESHNDVMLLWDVLFASPYTPQFELIVTAGLVRHVSGQIIDQSLSYDELLKFANAMSGQLRVTDVVLIAHDFYDFIASHMVRRSGMRAGENAFRPKLVEILTAFDSSDINGNAVPPLTTKR